MPTKKLSLILIITITLTLGLSISLGSLLAAWTAPASAPPEGNIASPINTSATGFLYGPTGIIVTDFENTSYQPAAFYFDNDTVIVRSGDGVAFEDTDISATIDTDATWYNIEIRVTTTSVVFLVNGAIVATHSTRVPDRSMVFAMVSRNKNAVRTQIRTEYVKIYSVPD